ncbi:lipopolysaccharide biosynthesis protein [Salaquimonas pukyongi]|uniref:lipopolysaccharide biosynthesis protein n=1 Tax=Salaquimonas pukyongi TaxID=2712698 RepID=UPI001FCDCCD4|nr:lipopolysaccharide biosynthesis protein [Salaquimonas pukyongi]
MNLNFIPRLAPLAERSLPRNLALRAVPHLERVDAIVSGNSDSAVSGRIALFAFAIRILSAVIAYISQVLLARWMGQFEYGIFVAVWVAAVILGGIACLGFQTGIIRFISEYREQGEAEYLRGAISGSLIWAVLAATLIAALGSAGVYWMDGLFENYFVIPIYLAAVFLPMLALQEVQDGIARAHNWAGVALAPTFILRPILILAAMAAAILLGFPATAVTAMISAIVAVYAASILQFVLLVFKLRKAVPKGPRKFMPAKWLAITMPIFLIEGFYNLLTNVDILFVSHYMRPEKVAVYFAAAKTLALVHFVYFAVKAAAAHRFSAYRTAGDRQRYEQFIQETVHWTFWPSLVLALLMLVVGKYFLMLFGPAFVEEGVPVIWILTLGIIVRSSVGAAESVLTMSGEQKVCAFVYAATLLFNLILNWQLIPVYGLNGAAMATSGALFFEAFALYAAARRRLSLHIFILPMRGNKAQTRPAE